MMAVKTVYELYDILDTVGNIALGISALDKAGNINVVISDDDARAYIKQKYATRRYPVILGRSATITDARESFEEIYTIYLKNHQHGINKQYQALYEYDYSPIENVDRHETETSTLSRNGTNSNTRTDNLSRSTTYGRTESNSGTDTTTYGHVLTESGTDTMTDSGNDINRLSGADTLGRSGSIVNETEKAGFNAPNTYTPDTKTTERYNSYEEDTTYGKTETTTHGKSTATQYGKTDTNSGADSLQHGHMITQGGTDTESNTGTVSDSGTTSESGNDSRTLHVHGNIGVTTNNQLIEAEIAMRKMSLAEMIIDNIINDYTYYS